MKRGSAGICAEACRGTICRDRSLCQTLDVEVATAAHEGKGESQGNGRHVYGQEMR